LKPEWWGSTLVQEEKYQGIFVYNNNNNIFYNKELVVLSGCCLTFGLTMSYKAKVKTIHKSYAICHQEMY
jgi:hypothetical protein